MERHRPTAIVLALLASPAAGTAAARTKGVDGGVIAGRRLKLIRYDLSGEPVYRLSGRYRGRRVVTDFSFHRGRAESVSIFTCPRSGSCGAAPR